MLVGVAVSLGKMKKDACHEEVSEEIMLGVLYMDFNPTGCENTGVLT